MSDEQNTTTTPIASNGNSSSSFDVAQALEKILSSNQGNLQELAKKASTPIPGGHSGQLPLSMQQGPSSIGPYNRIPTKGIVGKGNARAAGIGNAVIGTTHLLAGAKTALDNKKKVEVASATMQLLTAQTAYDQAQQMLKQDPNNADAKAASDRNKTIMNGILSNDKLRKAISKGMNVDFTDPKANDTLEHQGVAQGKEMAKAHMSYADQFNEKTPFVMQPNQQAIAQYQAAQAQQKQNIELFRAWAPVIKEGKREDFESWHTMQMAQQKKEEETLRYNHDLLEQTKTASDAVKLEGMRLAGERTNILAGASKEIDLMYAKMQLQANDPDNIIKSELEAQNINDNQISKLDEQKVQLLGKLSAPGVDSSTKKLIQSALDQNAKDRTNVETTFKGIQKFYDIKKQKVMGLAPQGVDNGGTGTANTNRVPTQQRPPNYNGRGLVNTEATKAIDFYNSFVPKSFQVSRPNRGELPTWDGEKSN